MTVAEMQKAIEQLKAEGHSEKDILGSFYKMFQKDELSIDELDGIVNLMGYHLTDDFMAMSPEDQKTKGYEEVEEPDNETVEESKNNVADQPEDKPEDKPEGESEEKPEDDSEEKKRAMELFNFKK